MMVVKADLVICSPAIGVPAVLECAWLSCQAIIWVSVLAGLFWIFTNPVMYL